MSDTHRRRRRAPASPRPSRAFARRSSVELLEGRALLTLAGNQLFPSDNPWNQVIANAPVAANSSAIIGNIISLAGKDGQLHPDFGQDTGGSNPLFGIPYNIVHGNSTPRIGVVIDGYPDESDIQPAPIPANAVLEGDRQNGPTVGLANRGDSHLIVYDEDNNVAYEFYGASRPSENGDGKWHAAQESVWNLAQDSFRPQDWTSADAAGLPILPGLVRPDEALPVAQGGQGAIDHAIRFTLTNKIILDQFLYPASHVANPGNTNAAVEPAMGTRFRLKASVDISGLSPESQVIAQAMKTYGLILADNGSNFFFSGASESVQPDGTVLTWNDNDIQGTLTGLKSLTYSDFEVVNTTPVVTGLGATTAAPGSTVTVLGQNFSGAAGHLQVFFGTTAAANVTVVDDAHVTATVPAGTGTVDVRVQSGATTGTDPENIKSPIFGYGTSAQSSADRFTFVNQAAPPTVSDAGFESPTLGVGPSAYQYAPSGSPWAFAPGSGTAGGSGIAGNNSGFTAGNPPAPEGSQVAFLQAGGSFSQAVAGWAAGSYSVTFQAAQRGNAGPSNQQVEVMVDGNLVGTIDPSGTSYRSYATAPFAVAAGTHTIEFLGLSASIYETAFIDQVAVATAPASATVSDAGFESPTLGVGPSAYQYAPSGSPWAFAPGSGTAGGSGIAGNNSGFTAGNPPAPEGSQVAFLQAGGSFSQSVASWAAGSYSVTFQAAQRGNAGPSNQQVEVLIDNAVVGTIDPSGTAYQVYTTPSFAVTSGAHTIKFLGLSASIYDTAFVNAVAIATAPTSATVSDAGFESPTLGVGPSAYQYAPSGSPWAFAPGSGTAGGSGIAGNNSGFTAGNPSAPEGSQVAFLQAGGSFSQSVASWAAGSYSVTFQAAQRGNAGPSNQQVEVMVNGILIGTFDPSGTSYQAETSSPFAVTAGTHTIKFVGLSTSIYDTAFIDAVAISPA